MKEILCYNIKAKGVSNIKKLTDREMAEKIAQEVLFRGGRTFYVGGSVRDMLSGADFKDVDIEVHGIKPDVLEGILDKFGDRISIGESFGIYNLKGYSLDIAMPRKEELRGKGHKDFDIFVDPFIGTKKAAKRRDFTINAIMQDVLTGEIIDHFGGQDDLKNGIIRHVNDKTFKEDSLRVLRAAQFASRFEFDIAEETTALCRDMELSNLPSERVIGELKKALIKARHPSIFFEALKGMGKLDTWFPELSDLIGIEQRARYHAEGDVYTHTMMVLDEAASYREKVDNPLGFMLAAITHDFGKAVCTERVNGEIHAYGHEAKGLPPAEKFMRRLTNETELIKYVTNLTEHHMKPNIMAKAGSSVKATNKMLDESCEPMALICLALADSRGRKTLEKCEYYDDFLYERLRIYKEYMSRPYVTGKDLIDAGLTPDESFSKVLSYAHKLRLAGVEKEIALRQTLSYKRKL